MGILQKFRERQEARKVRMEEQRLTNQISRFRRYGTTSLAKQRIAQGRNIIQRKYAEYKPNLSSRSPMVSRGVTQAIASVGGVRVPYKSSGRGGHSRPGRPRGSYSSMYAAYGGVYGYRKAMAYQRRMALLKAQQQMQQIQRNPQMAQQIAYQRQLEAPGQPIQQMQEQLPVPQQIPQQKAGVGLWDPTFMKLDTGQSNIQNGKVMMDAFNPETPSGSPEGDYYTEPDFFSGKQVLRRRSGDRLFKW